MRRHFASQCFAVLICLLVPLAPSSLAQRNEVLEEVELIGAGKVENTSGVWVDGQYLGYLKELKGSPERKPHLELLGSGSNCQLGRDADTRSRK
jgi:hypothetical protein